MNYTYFANTTLTLTDEKCTLAKESFTNSVNQFPKVSFYLALLSFLILAFYLIILPRINNKTLAYSLGIYPLILAMCILFLSLWLQGALVFNLLRFG